MAFSLAQLSSRGSWIIYCLDDILVAGSDEEDYLRTLSLVLEQLLAAGFRLNKAK